MSIGDVPVELALHDIAKFFEYSVSLRVNVNVWASLLPGDFVTECATISRKECIKSVLECRALPNTRHEKLPVIHQK